MNAGKLRHSIAIERYVSIVDDWGQPIEAWELVGSFRASVEPLSGREYFAAQAAQADITTKITMRYQPGILSTDRVTHNSTVYNVLSIINPKMRDEKLILMCRSTA
jgi:SPP1 family predicted phage head-tail adaptor